MAVQQLNRAQAFGGGSDLWVLPTRDDAEIFKKIDWYLNFQISRAHHHERQDVPPQIRSILNENQMPNFSDTNKAKAPLMISASEHFPTITVIEIPIDGSSDQARSNWIKQVHDIWQKLNSPPLRVFLPSETTVDKFKLSWPGSKNDDITVVLSHS